MWQADLNTKANYIILRGDNNDKGHTIMATRIKTAINAKNLQTYKQL